MVTKQCAHCGRYFGGDLNGDYVCPDCVRHAKSVLRPLVSLDGLSLGFAPDPGCAGPRIPPGSQTRAAGAKGQAA